MIPAWDAGRIPPVRPGEEGSSPERSPYTVSITQIISRFGLSSERRAILSGLLDYRHALYEAGLVEGFQWIDGSFVEDVERLFGRSPNDVDVVTFLRLPEDQSQESLGHDVQQLFDINYTKQHFKVDAYVVVLGGPIEEWHVDQIAYWYSMWSHTRENIWKGFLSARLDPDGDESARELLSSMRQLEGEQ